MRVLVTGAGGFVGARVLAQLDVNGHTVTACVRTATPGKVVLDVTSYEAARAVVLEARPQVIVNLASYGCVATQSDRKRITSVNVLGAVNLFELAREASVERFVQLGSALQYGYSSTAVDEECELRPAGAYAVSKACAWHLLRDATLNSPVAFVELRPFNLYGEGNLLPRLDAQIVDCARRGEPIQLSAGTQLRDFLSVDDAARAIAAVATCPAELFPAAQALNIARGEPNTVRDFATQLATALGSKHLLRFATQVAANDHLYTEALRWKKLAQRLHLPDPEPLSVLLASQTGLT